MRNMALKYNRRMVLNLILCFLFEQMFFAKYDAVERYLRRATYPPGLNSVEKNTSRRFAKKYIIKGLYKGPHALSKLQTIGDKT